MPKEQIRLVVSCRPLATVANFANNVSDLCMDFITGLPKSQGKEVILVVVYCLTKYNHFLGLNHPYDATMVAQVFIDSVYRLHGLPKIIVRNWDPIFISTPWQELFKHLWVTLGLSSSYYPQIDDQMEVVNSCLKSYLRCMTRE